MKNNQHKDLYLEYLLSKVEENIGHFTKGIIDKEGTFKKSLDAKTIYNFRKKPEKASDITISTIVNYIKFKKLGDCLTRIEFDKSQNTEKLTNSNLTTKHGHSIESVNEFNNNLHINEDFLLQEEDKEGEAIKYYISDLSLQWWGILNKLYYKSHRFKKISDKIQKDILENYSTVILLYGDGGWGKTSMARQLAVDFATLKTDNYSVFWIDLHNSVSIEESTDFIKNNFNKNTIIFIDDWMEFSIDQQKLLSGFINKSYTNHKVCFIITNREEGLENFSRKRTITYDMGGNLTVNEFSNFVTYVSEKINLRKEKQLNFSDKNSLPNSRPFLITYVLARLDSLKSKEEIPSNFESLLKDIVKYDLENMPRNSNFKLALQLYASWLGRPNGFKAHNIITKADFVSICAKVGNSLELNTQSEKYKTVPWQEVIWRPLHSYLSPYSSGDAINLYGRKKTFDSRGKTNVELLGFNHDILLDALSTLSQSEFSLYKQDIRDILLNSNSQSIASNTLFNLVMIEKNNILKLSEEEAWPHFERLLDSKNSHHAWAGLIFEKFNEQIKKRDKTKTDYIIMCKKVVGSNSWFDKYLLRYANKEYGNDFYKVNFLKEIMDKNIDTATDCVLIAYRNLLKNNKMVEDWKHENERQLNFCDEKAGSVTGQALASLLANSSRWPKANNRSKYILNKINVENINEFHDDVIAGAITNLQKLDSQFILSFIDRFSNANISEHLQLKFLKIVEEYPQSYTSDIVRNIQNKLPLSISQQKTLVSRKTAPDSILFAKNYLESRTFFDQNLITTCLDILRREKDFSQIVKSFIYSLPLEKNWFLVFQKCIDMLRYENDTPDLVIKLLQTNPGLEIQFPCFFILNIHKNYTSQKFDIYIKKLANSINENIVKNIFFRLNIIKIRWVFKSEDWIRVLKLIYQHNPFDKGKWYIEYLKNVADPKIKNNEILNFLTKYENRINSLYYNLSFMFAYSLQELGKIDLTKAENILQKTLSIKSEKFDILFLQYRLYQTPLENSEIFLNILCNKLEKYLDVNTQRDFVASCLIGYESINKESNVNRIINTQIIIEYYLNNWRNEYNLQHNWNRHKSQDPTITKHLQISILFCLDRDLQLKVALEIFNDDDIWMNYPQLFRSVEDIILRNRNR